MAKYHDQKKIQEVVKRLKGENPTQRETTKKFFIQERKEARAEVLKISAYTAPEDAQTRLEVLYYYSDIIKEMGWDKEKLVSEGT